MSDFKAKMHQIRFRLGLRPRPAGGAYSAPPHPLAGFKNGPLWHTADDVNGCGTFADVPDMLCATSEVRPELCNQTTMLITPK